MTAPLHHALRTDTGRVRPGNEDAVGTDAERSLFVIADGMGGHEGGEVASRLAVETALQVLAIDLGVPPDAMLSQELLRGAVLQAHQRVLLENMERDGSAAMGTTLIVARIAERVLHFAHVGDSRLLRVRQDGTVDQLTRDQTLAQQMRDAGVDETRITARDNSTLLQAIGLKGYLVPATGRCEARPGDTFVLCTDGLSDLVSAAETARVVRDRGDDLEAAADALVARANEAGGSDNISVILVRV